MVRTDRRRDLYRTLLALLALTLVTLLVHGSLPYRSRPEVYGLLLVLWTLLFTSILRRIYENDFEISARLQIARFADISAAALLELRRASSSILEGVSQAEIDSAVAQGVRSLLNLAHEYFSYVTEAPCTASMALISDTQESVKTVHYDDFVPLARADKSVEIPLRKGLFGEILARGLRVLIIDDYTRQAFEVHPTPNIENRVCVSGIVAPIKSFDQVVGFFDLDSPKPNKFKPNGDESAALFFAEALGQLIQIAEFKSRGAFGDEGH